MYHWSITDYSLYHWRFCIKAGDRILADRVPILELHVQPDSREVMTFHGDDGEMSFPIGPQQGEIHIYHPSTDEYNDYLEEMFDQNGPELTMELWPNLTTDTINVFHNVRMRSANYFPFSNLQVVETRWVFRTGTFDLQNTTQVREGSILEHILDTDPTELVIGTEHNKDKVQKLDWRDFGF